MLRADAPAKLNLSLHLTAKRADGYHELESIVVFTTLADHLTITPADTLTLTLSGPFAAEAGEGEGNLVLKAARLLQAETGCQKGAAITLVKNIPVGGGLGGGSSDAAAALTLLNELWGLGLTPDQLRALAPRLGADVAMFIDPVPSIARGIGEVLEPIAPLPPMHAVLVHPRKPLLSKDVYAACGAIAPHTPLPNIGWASIARDTRNDLQRPAITLMPEVAEILVALETASQKPVMARMTGSGACCFALYEHEKSAETVAAALRSSYPHWWVMPTRVA